MDGIIEIIFKGLVTGLFAGAKRIGLFFLKAINSNINSEEGAKEKYENSITPYIIGFSIYFILFCLIIYVFA